jgi:hypothetical protein
MEEPAQDLAWRAVVEEWGVISEIRDQAQFAHRVPARAASACPAPQVFLVKACGLHRVPVSQGHFQIRPMIHGSSQAISTAMVNAAMT